MWRPKLLYRFVRTSQSLNIPARSFHRQAPLLAPTETRKRLDVAIVGLPNAGKSQLLNVLTNSNIAAVSRKRHTTRNGILGARTVDDTQLVFVDTPGFLKTHQAKREGLDRNLVVTAAAEMETVDYTLLVVDAARTLTDDHRETLIALMLQALSSQGRVEFPEDDEDWESDEESEEEQSDDDDDGTIHQKFAVVLNKVDLVYPKTDLLDLAMEIGSLAEECIQYSGQTNDDDDTIELDPTILHQAMPTFFYISALKNDGVDDLLQFLLSKATPSKEWELEPGQSTSLSPEERVEEIVREKIYRCLHREVPHQIKQSNRLFRVAKDKQGKPGLLIHQVLMVQTKSHYELVHGRTLERIRDTAERDLKKLFGCEVVLHLHVKLVKSRNRRWSI